MGTPRQQKATLAGVITRANEKTARNLGVAMPGNIVSYNAGTRTATVRPGVNRLVPNFDDADQDVVEALPDIPDVSVVWFRSPNFQLVDELSEGHPVLLLCMDRAIDGWQASNKPAAPADSRVHHWGSCVALVGLTADVGGFSAPSDAAALASKLDQLIGILRASPETGAGVIKAAVDLAFPGVPSSVGTPNDILMTTTGSEILKVGK